MPAVRDIAFRLIMVGEASKNLTDKARRSMPTVKWKDMARMRLRCADRWPAFADDRSTRTEIRV